MYRPPHNFNKQNSFGRNNWRLNFGQHGNFYSYPQTDFYEIESEEQSQQMSKCQNEEYWCETCDKAFRNQTLLQNHKLQHQKCNIDGCPFVAHPNVITKHIQMQHSSGLYKKISKLSNPEEIEKWRNERRKKYPTKQNIEKKEAEINEKVNRGERLGLKKNERKESRKSWSFKPAANNKRKHAFGSNNNDKSSCIKNSKSRRHSKKPQKTFKEILPSSEDNVPLKPFAGILGLLLDNEEKENEEENDCLIEDIESEELIKKPQEDKIAVCGALSSLICNYESDEEMEQNKEIINKNEQSLLNIKDTGSIEHRDVKKEIMNGIQAVTNETDIVSDDDSGPEEVKTANTEDIATELPENKEIIHKRSFTNVHKTGKPQRHIHRNAKSKLPSTLLEKLLYKEIRQERNIVLQCIRHIIANNYFEKK